MRDLIWHLSIILLIGGAIFFTNLGQARLWDRDEPRNAGCAAEMLARGDWVVPTFNDELRHQKPVLLYWLIMSAYSVFGVNEFAARFWSAVLALVTTFATYGIGRKLVSPRVGLLAAVALASSLMFDVAARAATPDSVLVCCSTCAIFLYVIGTFSNSAAEPGQETRQGISTNSVPSDSSWFPKNIWITIAMYVVMGLGVLAKGPVGFLLPMAIIGMFMLVMRLDATQKPKNKEAGNRNNTIHDRILPRFVSLVRPFHPWHFLKTVWAMRPLLAASIVLLVAAPWYLFVAEATDGVFIQKFFVGEHFGRATVAMENHSGGLWFYPVAILIGFFPWSVLWGPVVVSLLFGKSDSKSEKAKDESNSKAIQVANVLLLSWVCVQVGLFSLAQTKLPSYVTPCYPALAILASICLTELAAGRIRIHIGWYVAAFVGLAISGLAISGTLGFATSQYMPGQTWLSVLGLIPLAAGCVMIMMLLNNRKKQLPTIFASFGVLFCWLLFGFGTVSLDDEQQSHLVLGELENDTVIASFGCLESSWVFYSGQPIFEIATTPPVDNVVDEVAKPSLFRVSTSKQNAKAEEARQQASDPTSTVAVRTKPDHQRKYWQPKASKSLESFVRDNPEAVFLTSSDHIEDLKKRLPKDYEVLQTAEYFLKNKKIYLVGQRPDSVRSYY